MSIIVGDCLDVMKTIPSRSVHCCVTSPPYWRLRDYGVAGQLGFEKTPEEHVERMTDVFWEVRRILRDDGVMFLNIGDTYAQQGGPGWQGKNGQRADRRFTLTRNTVPLRECSRSSALCGLKPKNLVGIPWRVAFALQADGWILRQDIIWEKPNPLPESVKDRCTKSHEYIFLMAKSERYYFDAEAIKEPVAASSVARLNQPNVKTQQGSYRVPGKTNGPMRAVGNTETRNKRSVWVVNTQPFKEAHFATFPPKLIEPCILAGCPKGGIVLDPFFGAGTTGVVCRELERKFIGIELNPAYAEIAWKRINCLHPEAAGKINPA